MGERSSLNLIPRQKNKGFFVLNKIYKAMLTHLNLEKGWVQCRTITDVYHDNWHSIGYFGIDNMMMTITQVSTTLPVWF